MEVEKTLSEKLDEIPKKTFVDPVLCHHDPIDDGTHKYWPGKETKCKLCGIVLRYNNNLPGSKKRMSKKERLRLRNAKTFNETHDKKDGIKE